MNRKYNVRGKKVVISEIPTFLLKEEVVCVLQFIESKRPKLRPLIQLAFETGLRFRELASLKNRKVKKHDENYYIVHFRRSKRLWNNEDHIFISKELLKDIRKFYNQRGLFMFEDKETGELPDYYRARYWIKQAIASVLDLDEEYLEGVGFHITRRTFMTVGVQDGHFSFEEGSRNLGHTSVRVTEKHYLFLRRNPSNSRVDYFKEKEK